MSVAFFDSSIKVQLAGLKIGKVLLRVSEMSEGEIINPSN